jgi:phosphonate transport system substrate-binding protein
MIHTLIIRYFLLGLVVIGLAACKQQGGGAAPSGKTIKIGYMLCNSEAETTARFRALTNYLSDKVGVAFEFVPVDTHEVEKRFKSGEFAFTHTNSLLYVVLKERFDVTLVASEKRGSFGAKTGGAIIARKGSGITKLADLKGKRFAFGPMLAPTGFLAEYDLLLKGGVDPERDLIYTIPSGTYKHEKLIYGVLYGQYDAAAAPVLDLEIMTREGKIAADDFTIVAQTQVIPYCTFAAAKGTDPALVEKVRAALVALNKDTTAEVDGERLKVLKAAWIDGYEVLADKEYDAIREMAKAAGMPPYQKY